MLKGNINLTIHNRFVLKIDVNLYHLIGDIIFGVQCSKVDGPLMELPQLTDNDVVVINRINKMLVPQLIKQSAMSIDRTDDIVDLN